MCPRSPCMYGRTRINHDAIPMERLGQGSPDCLSLSRSLTFSPYKSLSVEIGQGYRRWGEREGGERFACFASWLRQFVSVATNTTVVAARLGPTEPPTLSVSPSAGSSAALSSVDRTSPRTSLRRFPRARLLFAHIPCSLHGSFHFRSCIWRCIYDREYVRYLVLSIDRVLIVSRYIVFSLIFSTLNIITRSNNI